MRRRKFIALIGSTAVTWPVAARAQQSALPMIGFLSVGSPDGAVNFVAAFRRGLSETGYVEGRNVTIEYRWADSQYDRLPELAADLVRRRVTVIAAPGSIAGALAAKAATATIPIIIASGIDPVVAGLVRTLNRPGGNVTGVNTLNVEVGPKRMELLHEVLPTATIVALLVNPTSPVIAEVLLRDAQATASALGLRVHVLYAKTEGEMQAAFAALLRLKAGALVIGPDQFFNNRVEQLAALAVHHAMPAVYEGREFTAAGGLMSYGHSILEGYQLAGVYTGRILNGEKPADLPVQQSTKVELYINLKSAKTLGITFPLPLLGRADEVIE
jgi:putative tryptophan/tyrosine transport system substrate-binding protein